MNFEIRMLVRNQLRFTSAMAKHIGINVPKKRQIDRDRHRDAFNKKISGKNKIQIELVGHSNDRINLLGANLH